MLTNNFKLIHQALALAGVQNAQLQSARPSMSCFDRDQPQGEQAHTSANAYSWKAGDRTGYIVRSTGLVVETRLADSGRILDQKILPFAGSHVSASNRTFRKAAFNHSIAGV